MGGSRWPRANTITRRISKEDSAGKVVHRGSDDVERTAISRDDIIYVGNC